MLEYHYTKPIIYFDTSMLKDGLSLGYDVYDMVFFILILTQFVGMES